AHDRPHAGDRRKRRGRDRPPRAGGRARHPHDLHRRRALGDRPGAEAPSRRADLHAGDRPSAERSQVHRPRTWRLRRSVVRDPMKKVRRHRKVENPLHAPHDKWRTALTCIEPNKILMRGYPLDEIMGRLTFGEAIYLLLQGEVPSPGIGRLMEAILVSFIDHGATPPSTLAARNTATTGAATRACVAAGLLGFGRYHGGDIESCMHFLDVGLEMVRKGT